MAAIATATDIEMNSRVKYLVLKINCPLESNIDNQSLRSPIPIRPIRKMGIEIRIANVVANIGELCRLQINRRKKITLERFET
jgi:hypothetical protein